MQPLSDVLHHFIPVDFIEQFMPGFRVQFQADVIDIAILHLAHKLRYPGHYLPTGFASPLITKMGRFLGILRSAWDHGSSAVGEEIEEEARGTDHSAVRVV